MLLLLLLLLLFLDPGLLLQWRTCHAYRDAECLRTARAQLQDPRRSLSSWNFNNVETRDNICKFRGVQCWHNGDDRVFALKLSGLGLAGEFPDAVGLCRDITALDLSNNDLSGVLPAQLCSHLPYLVSLNLSGNRFSGPVPPDLGACAYLNDLNLSRNRLSGAVPAQLGALRRLRFLNLAHNSFSGPVPPELRRFPPGAFDGNHGLCGGHLSACSSSAEAVAVVAVSVLVAVVVTVFAGLLLWLYLCRCRRHHFSYCYSTVGSHGNNDWVGQIRSPCSIKVSMFEKPMVKIRFWDLMKATDYFSPLTVIGSGRTGTVYRGVLKDGSTLAVKRLLGCCRSHRRFKSEMNLVGRLRHRNLVPLLGYCVTRDERFLIYKFMVNDSVWNWLHACNSSSAERGSLDWITRLRIGMGIARGVAWLHYGSGRAVVHGNLSSACVMLDEDFEARITDFALANVMMTNHQLPTQISSFCRNETWDFGYASPECRDSRKPSLKGDIYSLGVILLELVTGRMPMSMNDTVNSAGSMPHIVNWVSELSKNGQIELAFDRSILGRASKDELHEMIRIACSCVVPDPERRPSSVEVYQLLAAIGVKHNLLEVEFFGQAEMTPDHAHLLP